MEVNYALLDFLDYLLVFFFNDSSLKQFIFLSFCFLIEHFLKSYNKMRVKERFLVLKEFWFFFNEFCPVHPVSMNCSLVISVSEVDFLCVWSSNPRDLASKGFVVKPPIIGFDINSAFLKQFRRKLTLLRLFLNVHLGLSCYYLSRMLGYDRILLITLLWIVLTIDVCSSLLVNLHRLGWLYKRLLCRSMASWEILGRLLWKLVPRRWLDEIVVRDLGLGSLI